MRDRPRLVGINHVALEVGGVDEALEFYGRLFSFTLRGKSAGAAFVDMGNQSLALERSHAGSRDGGRHFGLVVADALGTVGYFRDLGESRPGRSVRRDPVREGTRGPRRDGPKLAKSDRALAELRAKGLA